MIHQLKKLTVQMLTGGNVATIAVMLAAGYSDRLHPVDHPLFSTLGMTLPFFLVANLLFLVFWLIFKWTRAWIPVVGFALAYVPISIYMPLHTRQAVPEEAIKVISYNVCCYQSPASQSSTFDDVTDFLHKEQADIVCIQEDNDAARNLVHRKYANHFAYNDTAILCNNSFAFNCLGIHTRYPILRKERIDYPTAVNNGSVAWWLQVNGDTLIVINNHFESCHLNEEDRLQYQQMLKGNLSSDSVRLESQLLMVKLAEANAKRAVQIDRICEYAEEHLQYPLIVCGDFNDNPISYSRHAFSKFLDDSFTSTGRGLGLSYNRKGFYFRIDHLFCSKNLQPYNCKIDGNITLSDHYPLVCWIKMPSKQ